MAQAIVFQVPNLVQAVADSTAGTLTIQWWNSATSSWVTAQTVSLQTGLVTLAQGLADGSFQSAVLSANYTTTSTTLVSTGLGVTLTPEDTKVMLDGRAVVNNNTAGDGVTVAIYQSTVGIPAAGSAPASGDTAILQVNITSSAASQNQVVPLALPVTSLTAGTKYYFYLAVAAVTGGTAQVNGGSGQTALTARVV
jgi:hypothetical protein